jgi:hypothetical protein
MTNQLFHHSQYCTHPGEHTLKVTELQGKHIYMRTRYIYLSFLKVLYVNAVCRSHWLTNHKLWIGVMNNEHLAGSKLKKSVTLVTRENSS